MDENKRIRIEIVENLNCVRAKLNTPELIKQYYMDAVMYEFRNKLLELKAEEIISIQDNPYGKSYTLDVVFNKIDDYEWNK